MCKLFGGTAHFKRKHLKEKMSSHLVDKVDVLVGEFEVKLDLCVVDGKVGGPLDLRRGRRRSGGHPTPALLSMAESDQTTSVAEKDASYAMIIDIWITYVHQSKQKLNTVVGHRLDPCIQIGPLTYPGCA